MKTLKMIFSGFLVIVLSVLTGCSDSITSSGETGSSNKGEGVIASTTIPVSVPVQPNFKSGISLKPNSSYTFNMITTGFDRFYSIDVTNLSYRYDDDQVISECDNIKIYSVTSAVKLSCHSNDFEVRDITVENTGPESVDLNVRITGFKQKKDIKKDLK